MDDLSNLVGFLNQVFGEDLSIALCALFAATVIPTFVRRINSQVRNRIANQIRNRTVALENMDTISNEMFKRMFRMSRESFDNLLGLLEDSIESFTARITYFGSTPGQPLAVKIGMRAKRSLPTASIILI